MMLVLPELFQNIPFLVINLLEARSSHFERLHFPIKNIYQGLLYNIFIFVTFIALGYLSSQIIVILQINMISPFHLFLIISRYFITSKLQMVSPSFVMQAYSVRGDATRRKVDFRQTKLRYFIVVVAIFVVFGCEYCFDNPSALQTQIQENQHEERGEELSQAQFNLLYSLYAFPNVVVPLFGGMLIDTKGPRIALLITASFCVLGQIIFSLGGFKNIWTVMLIGRIVFGLGGEVLHAAQNTIISRWFKASQLSMVLGICISFPKMGSSLNSVVSPQVSARYQHDEHESHQYLNVGMPMVIGLGFMILSLILGFILAYYDRKTQKLEQVKHESAILSKTQINNAKPKSILNKKSSKYGQVNFLERTEIDMNDKQMVEQGGGHLDCKAIARLPITYWLLLVVAMLSEALFIPFLDNGNIYFQSVYKVVEKPEDAGTYLILPYVVSSVFVVPLGFFADKVRKRGYLLIGSTGFIFITYAFMMFTQANVTMRQSQIIPWVPVFLLGICIAIFCTIIVPTVPMICPPQLLGTGFGMMEMLQNLALGVFPLLAGAIRETQKIEENKALGRLKGFHLQTLFFYLIACLCVAFAIFLETADRFRGNKLSKKDFKKTYINKVMKE